MASWDKKLLTAAEKGNIKEVELCVKNGANLECSDYFGRTPLMMAAGEGHLEVLTYLITHSSQLDSTNEDGETPLLCAAERGHLEMVIYLVSNGSQLDATSTGGVTPLMFAAVGGHLEVVTYLVTHGSQLDATSTRGETPLMWAVWGGHQEVMTYLVTQGSQLEATDEDGQTALHLAAEKKGIDATKWLIDQGCSPWVKSKQGQTPYDLVTISKYSSEEKKKEVMDFLKNVMSKTSPEVTPDTHLQEPAAPVVEDKIRDNADRIIQDIQISQILDHMMTHLVISVDDRRCIEQHAGQDDQNKALLDIVIKRKEPVYSVFVDGLLNYGYEDIANDLKCDTQETSPSTTLVSAENEGLSDLNVPLYKVRIQKNYLKIITDIQHENIVDHLISREVLSVDDGKKIDSGKTPQEKNRTLTDMLLCKKEQGFFEFLKALRKDQVYADLADQIEKTLVTSTDISILHKCLK
ncbi:uncharacterized protein LOC143052302 isoform X2 [Mytilus galloprovincialis]|uniref:uncharacterized protein LOC143052302 isoform X2 n=1 Tax=Mytilus galloprovincialis TaxID=29158 RepID=UPI003F7B70D8